MTDTFRIATYNVEWFNSLFDDKGQLMADDDWSGRHDVTRIQQLEALGIVFTALDADAIMVIEAPDTSRRRSGMAALEVFAEFAGIRARKALIGYANHTQQEIALLYDPDRLTARHDPQGDIGSTHNAPRFDGDFRIDLDIDDRLDKVSWSKPPLEVALSRADGTGRTLRLIGVHAKSKAPHGADDAADAMRIAIAARRKQLAQCLWLRRRVDGHLAASDPLIVLGDFNDGPGLDAYERLFGRSGVEIVIGDDEDAQLYDPAAETAMLRRIGPSPTTARFFLGTEKRFLEALIDFVMVSPDLRDAAGPWRIWHPFDDPVCFGLPELREALLTASDHFPVSVELTAPFDP